MKKIPLYLSLLLILLSATESFAQQKLDKFSEQTEEMLKQLEPFMTSSKREIMDEAYRNFAKQARNNAFTPEEISVVVQTMNGMLAQKMTASPYFLDYLRCLGAAKKEEKKAGEHFKEFHKVLAGLLADIEKGQLNPYANFLTFAFNFYEKNTIYTDGTFSWIANGDPYIFEYKEKKPQVSFEKLVLICARKQDSIAILNTKGIFFPLEFLWKGNGGKVNWTKFGLEQNVYAAFTDYSIDVKKVIYNVPKVKLHYSQLFPDGDIEGSFEDKLIFENKAVEGSYPRFESFDKVLTINNLGAGVRYRGGFRLQGTSVYGLGSKDEKAYIGIFDEQKKQLYRGEAELFVIRKGEKIVGEQVKSTLYFAADSIYHPSVNFRYEIAKKELFLERGVRGSDRNPFNDSYHKVNINSDKIDWFIAADSMVINQKNLNFGGAGNTRVNFESFKFYEESDYRRIQGISSNNPLAVMRQVALAEGKNTLDANVLAKEINSNLDVTMAQSLYFDLVAKGFINYDSEKQTVTLRDKVFHYAEANQKKVDFDILNILSDFEKTNAVFFLKDKNIEIKGVKGIEFSPTQKVAAKPFLSTIRLQNNRNINFDGKFFAGFGTFQGKDFGFDYDRFQVKMDSVRYFDLFIPTGAKDKAGQPVALSMASRIEHLSGILLIDGPNNKSGKEDIAMFPSLQTKTSSYIFYDRKETQDAAYRRDSFFFKLDKFSLNSLDKFVAADVAFKGSMISADIFPEFKETVTVQKDQSLGFTTQTPADGYGNYRNKGNYKGSVSLSNSGFLGNGILSYLGAAVQSDTILFRPKQLTCNSRKFNLAESRDAKLEVPQALGLDVNVNWLPYRDSMYVTTREKPFALFPKEEHTLKGVAILTPGGLKGDGIFDWSKGNVTSRLMAFGAFSTSADTMDLKIRSINKDELAFDTKNIKGKIDFDEQFGRFKANSNEISTTMPYNKYQTSMNEFDWDLKNETIKFKNIGDKLATFRSIAPDQDSLTFQGQTAFYDLKNNELKIGGIPFIKSADAVIYPENGDVLVRSGGAMDSLTNTKIVCDTLNKYHVINRSTVYIKGKKLYTAKGFYEYNVGDKKQEILFSDIVGARVGKGKMSERLAMTRATGEIKPEDSFYIDKKTNYYGKISMQAENKNLKLEGFARLQSETLPNRRWFSINSGGDKNDLLIKYDVPKDFDGNNIRTGLYASKETGKAYPSVMQPLFFTTDRTLIDVRGIFKYNKLKDEFIFGDSAKIVSGEKRGNKLVFSNKDGNVAVEGTFKIGSGLKYISVKAAGKAQTVVQEVQTDSAGVPQMPDFKVKAELMAGIEAFLPDKLLDIIINDIQSSAGETPYVDYIKDGDFYEKSLAEFIPDNKELLEEVVKMREKTLDLSKKHNPYAFFFSNLSMKWNPDYQSLITTKDKLGLSSIKGVPLNKMISAFVEFRMPSSEDDRVYIYLKSPSENYYYFGYQQGVMSAFSSDPKFMEALDKLKKKDKQKKMKDGELYEIEAAAEGTPEMFVRRIQAGRN